MVSPFRYQTQNQIKMAKIKKVIFGLFVAVVALSSCNKDNDDTPVVSETVATPSEEVVARDLSKQISPQAMSSTQIYSVAWNYKLAYTHLKQYDGECSWTSYVLTAMAVARGSWQGYPNGRAFSSVQNVRDKIQHVKNECGGSSHILDIMAYYDKWDKPKYDKIRAERKSYGGTNYTEAGKALAERRKNGNDKPCIFITSSNNIGHYVILWDLEWTGDPATSYVWVTDPLKGDTENFSTFANIVEKRNLRALFSANIMNYLNFIYFN